MMPPPAPAAAPAQPASGPTYFDVDCPLEALPKLGGIQGRVIDSESKAGIPNASVVVKDKTGKEFRATTDSTGGFKVEGLAPGAASVKTEADKFFAGGSEVEIKSKENVGADVTMSAKPKVASVAVQGKEIVIKKQILFEKDSSQIKGESNQLMSEIVDVFQRNPNIRKVEIQGHTDNTGTPDHNMQLSQARAESVRAWLTQHGIEAGRLEAKGYGQTRPRVPNVTAGNRAMNRRVQFIITDRAGK